MAWNQIPDSPPTVMRHDGYVNVLNKFGTAQDNSTHYRYLHQGMIPDQMLTEQYETNGLFSKIIDNPAEEAIKHGFDIGLSNEDATEYIMDKLDELEWEDNAATAVKWARLYGGALGVMLIDDGGGLEEPLKLDSIKSIDEIRIYERAVVNPDYTTLYGYGTQSAERSAKRKFGTPEYYQVNSIYGHFFVHESRCLVFKNGKLPERTANPLYRFWGIPEYMRIRRELQETSTSHSLGVKMLDRSVQAIYGMKDLAKLTSTDGGDDAVIRRLQLIDQARGLLNSIAIDSEGETYDFKTIPMAGVKDVIDTTCNILSAVTNIPQTILFGRSPAGMNATGDNDLENYYNFVEKIQQLQLKNNLQRLLDIVVRAGLHDGKLDEEPAIKLEFNPLWSMSESDQADIDSRKAQTQQVRASTAQTYVDLGVIDPAEVRKALASDGEFNIEEMLDDDDDLDDLWGAGLPDDLIDDIPETVPEDNYVAPAVEDTPQHIEDFTSDSNANPNCGVGVIVLKDETVLVGHRCEDSSLCGPGGFMEDGETPAQAAIRECQEEFGITPLNLKLLGQLDNVDNSPRIYLCTDYEGEVKCDEKELFAPFWLSTDYTGERMFEPFAESLKLLETIGVSTNSAKNSLTESEKADRISDAEKHDDDDEQFFTAKNGKVYKKNTETGETSGLGPDIDSANSAEPFPDNKQQNAREVESFLKKQGFEHVGGKGGDQKWKDPISGEHVSVPKHGGKNIKDNTLRNIKKQYNYAIEKRKERG